MKGIILAGGSGARLHPATIGVNKQLLPVYDKPMIYYPLTTLMLSGIHVKFSSSALQTIRRPISVFWVTVSSGGWIFSMQCNPARMGWPETFLIGEQFIGQDSVCLILGDNIFHGHGLSETLQQAASQPSGATVFGYYVQDPERYGVVEFNKQGQAISIEEKPLQPKSNYAVTGLYFYDNSVVEIAKRITPSARGELEITDVNNVYLQRQQLRVERMEVVRHGWIPASHDSLLDASIFIRVLEKRQGQKVASPEETAFRMGFIDGAQIEKLAQPLLKSGYGAYLMRVLAKNYND